jgi:formylglycine-generating enzyme required for sulfatase activity
MRIWDRFNYYLESYISDRSFWQSASNAADPSHTTITETSVYPLICDLIKSETKRLPHSICILLGAGEEEFPFQIAAAKLQKICQIYTESGRPAEVFVGDWFDSNFNRETAIASLYTALNTESLLILDTGIYPDYNQESFELYTGYWQKNWQTYIHNHQELNLQAQQSLTIFGTNWLELVPNFIEIFTALQLDQHFLLTAGLPPLLPQILGATLADYADDGSSKSEIQNIEKLLAYHYQNLYELLQEDRSFHHHLYLALSLGHFQDKSFAQTLVIQFMQNWLKSQNIQFSQDLEIKDLANLIQPALQIEDWFYFQKLSSCFNLINIDCRMDLMDILYRDEFEFTTVRINAQGEVRRTRANRAKYFSQSLEPNLSLELVYIPTGILRMGSPRNEVGHETNESPMHWVALAAFFIGKYPITQAQWRAVAELPPVNQPLEPNPSEFQGSDRPVENISWHDAMEFCRRLSLKTGIPYRLPTEAEWEYACRAGTKSPFHFGETITSAIANFDGTYPYGFGAKGEYRQQTTDVGKFPAANDYGLYDMHGQVLEWCADPWHDDYINAPNDGNSWQAEDENFRVLRGGSWFNVAGRCRAASRHRYGADVWLNHVGFRVALSP